MKARNNLNKAWDFPKHIFKVFLVLFLGLFIQYTYLALSPTIYGINMDKFAANRNTVETELYANRGTIYDSKKNILALNVSSYTVIAYLSDTRKGDYVVDKKMTAEKLAPVLGMKADYIENLLSKKLYQVELGPGGRGITELKKEEIEDLNLPGIDFIEYHMRYYPNGDFASYVLGYAKQYEDGSIVGELGIESMYDELLKGKNGYLKYQRDRFGYKIPDTKEYRVEPEAGSDIYLTIDANIQRFIEGEVKEANEIYKPEWLQISVMEAKTGKILGTASTPSFDPNIRNITNYENPLVSYVYEPGSTMKIYTYMCAIDKGTYVGTDKFTSGSIKIDDYTIKDWNGKGWGKITYDKGFEYSSNVGVTTMIEKFIDKNDLKSCLKKYGFGAKTDIELPRELTGVTSFNYKVEYATAAFGQGITSTAIQQLQAASIIANNGKMVKPHIVDKIVNPNTKEIIYESKVDESNQLVKTSTISKIKDLMYSVVAGTDHDTTGYAYEIEGYDIIGKTGTSQIYDVQSGKYLYGDNDYIYSFAGMYPKDDPEIIIYAAMKKPRWGKNLALSNATKSILKSIAKYRNMFAEEQNNSSIIKYQLPSYISKNITTVKKDLTSKKIEPIIIGKGDKVINQYPSSGNNVLSYDKVILITNDTDIKMPNIKGWSRNYAITLFDLLGLKYEIDGYGYVVEQSISEGTSIKKGDKIKIKLNSKYDINKEEEKETNKEIKKGN